MPDPTLFMSKLKPIINDKLDLVSVTVSGGYKPLYQDEWTRDPRMSSERLADDLSRRTLLMQNYD